MSFKVGWGQKQCESNSCLAWERVGRSHTDQKTEIEEHWRINATHRLFLPNWPTPTFYTSHLARVTPVAVMTCSIGSCLSHVRKLQWPTKAWAGTVVVVVRIIKAAIAQKKSGAYLCRQ